jgi:hypothetical protein
MRILSYIISLNVFLLILVFCCFAKSYRSGLLFADSYLPIRFLLPLFFNLTFFNYIKILFFIFCIDSHIPSIHTYLYIFLDIYINSHLIFSPIKIFISSLFNPLSQTHLTYLHFAHFNESFYFSYSHFFNSHYEYVALKTYYEPFNHLIIQLHSKKKSVSIHQK